ncbi:MAG: division/cell wall cluster transcriptional repressor MraZ [Acidimicrobiales bacterium]
MVERMFLGEYVHSLDAKGRVILPARIREALGAVGFLTSEVDGCLAVWAPEEFELKAREMQERARGGPQDRNVARAFFSGTVAADPDRQGRIAIPAHLRGFAGLERDVVVAGLFDHLEIWDAETWRTKKRLGEEGLAAGAPGAASM